MEFTVEEIYPRILVYNNIFEDPQRMYDIVKRIDTQDNQLFESWKEWYTFGMKVEDFGIWFDRTKNETIPVTDIEPKNEIQEEQKYFITQLINGFHKVNNDYIKKFNVDVDLSATSKPINPLPRGEADDFRTFEETVKTWRWTGPSLCKYFVDAGKGEDLEMNYHSDYIREPITTPGYKFAITTTTYINDDYEGGDLDFVIDNKLVGYKPKMGDFVVFPSGHPQILTEDGKVYLHGVKNSYKTEKYFTRLYWTKFHAGDPLWFENEERYGKEEWSKMQGPLMEEYRLSVQKKDIDKCVRIR